MRWAVWQLGFCRQLRRHPPVFVFQMGKVSSRSVSEPLQVIYRGAVIHDHVFEGDRMQGETRELKKYLNGPNPPEKLYIISLVREPIVRNISTFFANFERYTGAKCESSSYDIPALKQLFLQNFPHRQPLEWFDERMKRYFDIDVYSKPFPECGYARYERGALLAVGFPDGNRRRGQKSGNRQFPWDPGVPGHPGKSHGGEGMRRTLQCLQETGAVLSRFREYVLRIEIFQAFLQRRFY